MYSILKHMAWYLYIFSAANRTTVDSPQIDACSVVDLNTVGIHPHIPGFSVADIYSPSPPVEHMHNLAGILPAPDDFLTSASPTAIDYSAVQYATSCQWLNETDTSLNDNFKGFVCGDNDVKETDISTFMLAEFHASGAYLNFFKYIDEHADPGDIVLFEGFPSFEQFPCETLSFTKNLLCMGWDKNSEEYHSDITEKLDLYKFLSNLLSNRNRDRREWITALETEIKNQNHVIQYIREQRKRIGAEVTVCSSTGRRPCHARDAFYKRKVHMLAHTKKFLSCLKRNLSSQDSNFIDAFARDLGQSTSISASSIEHLHEDFAKYTHDHIIERNRLLWHTISQLRHCHPERRIFVMAGARHVLPSDMHDTYDRIPLLVSPQYNANNEVSEFREHLNEQGRLFPYAVLVDANYPEHLQYT